MRLVFDIMGATEMSGGMRLHATEVIRAWAGKFPDDQLIVLGPEWANREFSDLPNLKVVQWKNERVIHRFAGQVFVAPVVRWVHSADYLVSLSPIVSPLAPRKKSVCFQHDWRHIKNPSEFPAIQKQYRRLWTLSASRALTNACISEKTRRETIEIVPSARTLMVVNGGDHPARWHPVTTNSPHGVDGIVTFGHHNNKRPRLVMEGYARLLQRHPALTEKLVVLGARGEFQAELVDYARSLGVSHMVKFPGFVSDADYQHILASARCIVLASSDEGYGLPIAEADFFGIPAIATSDSGLSWIFKNLFIAEPTAESMEAALNLALFQPHQLPARTLPTWADSVTQLRSFLDIRNSNIGGPRPVLHSTPAT